MEQTDHPQSHQMILNDAIQTYFIALEAGDTWLGSCRGELKEGMFERKEYF